MFVHDALKILLVGTIGDHHDLKAEVAVVVCDLVKDVSEERAPFLDGIEA